MKKLVLCLAAALLLGGCGTVAEINDKAYVIAVGLDEGDNGLLKVTYMFAYPSGGGEEAGGEKTDEKDMVTVEAPSLYSAMRLLDTFKSKRIDTNHTKLVAFSQKLAEKRGIFSYMADLVNTRGFRPSIYVCVSQQEPDELFKSMEPKQDVYIEKFIEHLFSKVASSGTSRAYLYNNYFSAMVDEGGYILPLVGVTDGDRAKTAAEGYPYKRPDDFALNYTAEEVPLYGKGSAALCGCAVFVGNKMVGTMGLMERSIVEILEKNMFFGQFCALVPGTGKYANVALSQNSRPVIKIKSGDVPEIDIDIELRGEYTGIDGAFHTREDYGNFVDYLNRTFSQKTEELLERTRTEFGADVLGLGDRAKINFLTYQDWRDYDWKSRYKNAVFKVRVNVDMNDFGELRFSPEKR